MDRAGGGVDLGSLLEQVAASPARAPRNDRAQEAARRELRRRLRDALGKLARALDFDLTIGGTHPGGIGNQELFEVLADRGWDYGANTRRLKDHVRLALLNAFEDADHVPLRLDVEQAAGEAILEWVAARLDGRVTDIDRPALSPGYRRAKQRAGYGSKAGTATGALRDAVLERGRVRLT